MSVGVQLLHPDAVMPKRAQEGDAGFDLSAVGPSIGILPGGFALIPTGIALALETGMVALIHPRSGLALKHGLTVLNAPGTVDSGYRGEVGVLLINHGKEPYTVNSGDRIAQMVLQSYLAPPLVEVSSVVASNRGANGFGSTGVAQLRAA